MGVAGRRGVKLYVDEAIPRRIDEAFAQRPTRIPAAGFRISDALLEVRAEGAHLGGDALRGAHRDVRLRHLGILVLHPVEQRHEGLDGVSVERDRQLVDPRPFLFVELEVLGEVRGVVTLRGGLHRRARCGLRVTQPKNSAKTGEREEPDEGDDDQTAASGEPAAHFPFFGTAKGAFCGWRQWVLPLGGS